MDGTVQVKVPASIKEANQKRPSGGEAAVLTLLKLGGLGIWALIMFSLLMAILAVWFQSSNWYTITGGGEIEFDQSRNDTLNSTQELHDWTFEATDGQIVTIRVISIDESDPTISLIAPDGDVLARNDDGGSGRSAQITRTIHESGTYTVRIRMHTKGDYRITVREQSDSSD